MADMEMEIRSEKATNFHAQMQNSYGNMNFTKGDIAAISKP